MKTLLRLDASARTTMSFSRELGDHFETLWLERHAGWRVTTRDLAAMPIGHIRNETIAGFYTPPDQMTPALREATAQSDALISELKGADALLITTPMYNFSIPSALKAWIDQIVRIGQTFSYDGKGFTGLVGGKKAYVVIAYGAGGYLDGGPYAGADFAQPYLRFILNFLGLSEVTFLPVEATTSQPARDDMRAFSEPARRTIEAAIASTDRMAA